MKKFTTIICTLAMLASLTACSSNGAPSGDFLDDKQIVVNDPADKAPESKPDDSSAESGSDEKTESKTDEKASENTDGDSDEKASDNADSKTDDKNSAPEENGGDSSAENTEKTDSKENKTENDNKQTNDAERALPLEQYPDGSYFTYDGKPCTDHDKCSWDTECNCVNFDRSIQSMGFAKYVYFQVTGRHVSPENKTEIDADITAESAKSTLMGVPLGTYIAVTQGNDVPHFMIAVDADENGITVYQANYGGGCVVRVTDFSWADFAEKFPHLDHYVK